MTFGRIFFCQLCHFPHQVNGCIIIFTNAQKLQHLLNDDCDVLSVSDPEKQLQRLQERKKEKCLECCKPSVLLHQNRDHVHI